MAHGWSCAPWRANTTATCSGQPIVTSRCPPPQAAPLRHRDRNACASRAAARGSDTNSISTRVATVPLASLTEIQPHRLRDRRAQRQPTRACVPTQVGDQRGRQPDAEHRRALRDRHTVRRRTRGVHVPPGLSLRERVLGLQRPHRIRRRNLLGQQLDCAVHTNRVLVGERPAAGHQPLEYHSSRPTPCRQSWNRPLKLEVRDCVREQSGSRPWGVPAIVSLLAPSSLRMPSGMPSRAAGRACPRLAVASGPADRQARFRRRKTRQTAHLDGFPRTVRVVRARHPLEGRSLELIGWMRRGGTLGLILVLPGRRPHADPGRVDRSRAARRAAERRNVGLARRSVKARRVLDGVLRPCVLPAEH
jgi:hypothetical protein